MSVYLFILQRKKKSLSYQVLSSTDLLTVNEEIKGKIKILYEEIPIQNVSLIILRIINDGNLPITSSDFERPISFSFGSESSILSAEIIDKSPSTLKPDLKPDTSQIGLIPVLLNNKDSITVKLLVSGFAGRIEPDARIVGVGEIKRIVDKSSNWEYLIRRGR